MSPQRPRPPRKAATELDPGERVDTARLPGDTVEMVGKKRRATNEEMGHRKEILLDICRRGHRLSTRNAYYQAQTTGIVTKGDSEYRKVQRAILEMRRDGVLPYEWIVDNSRTAHRPWVHNSPAGAIRELADNYTRDLWFNSHKRVEVWCESDSIAGMIREVAFRWGVPIFPTKGHASDSFVYESAVSTACDGRPLTVIYLGDLDPAGLEINEQTQTKLRRFTPDVPIEWVRLGVTIEQVEELGLIGSGNKPKKTSALFPYDETFECEALPAPLLRQLLDDEIGGLADHDQVAKIQQDQQVDLIALESLADWWETNPADLHARLSERGAA